MYLFLPLSYALHCVFAVSVVTISVLQGTLQIQILSLPRKKGDYLYEELFLLYICQLSTHLFHYSIYTVG